MSKKGSPEGRESMTGRDAEVAALDRAKSRTRTTQADRIKDALEDDEVREALKLHHQGRGA